jgi:hypothetical protein
MLDRLAGSINALFLVLTFVAAIALAATILIRSESQDQPS